LETTLFSLKFFKIDHSLSDAIAFADEAMVAERTAFGIACRKTRRKKI
jgi:hypothetical protein